MTRKEEREQIIDKICDWLKEHINEYHNPKCVADLLLINDLRKEFE